MSFEEWQKRPVYVAQCKTAGLARELGVFCFRFRVLPGYRDAEAQRARNIIANHIREMRRKGQALELKPQPALATAHRNLSAELLM